MTFVVQTQIDIFFNDGQSEFDGFEPLTVRLTLWVDLNFRDQMFHQLFAFKGIHHIVRRSLCTDFLPPSSGVFRLSLAGSWPGIPCRRLFGSQGSMKACRKPITIK